MGAKKSNGWDLLPHLSLPGITEDLSLLSRRYMMQWSSRSGLVLKMMKAALESPLNNLNPKIGKP